MPPKFDRKLKKMADEVWLDPYKDEATIAAKKRCDVEIFDADDFLPVTKYGILPPNSAAEIANQKISDLVRQGQIILVDLVK